MQTDSLRSALSIALLLLATAWLPGCWTVESAIESGMDAAGEAAGREVGEALGERLAARVDLPAAGTSQWNQFMASQAQVFFGHATSAAGYWPATVRYETGEWAEYRVTSARDETVYQFERAFLREADQQEWWRVSANYDDGEWVYEALIDPAEGEMVRLRARDPEGNEGEIPVTEETVYQPPQELTEESIEGATTGTVEVEVPAGTFTAEKVQYSGAGMARTVTWWLSDEVPGGVVQYQVAQDGEPVWTSVLLDHGTGATTELGSYDG